MFSINTPIIDTNPQIASLSSLQSQHRFRMKNTSVPANIIERTIARMDIAFSIRMSP